MKYWKHIYGINLWKLNRTLRKLASSKSLLEKQLEDGVLTIPLKPCEIESRLGMEQKREIERIILELDGFQLLKLVLFQECVPVYKETRRPNDIARTIEIHTQNNLSQQ